MDLFSLSDQFFSRIEKDLELRKEKNLIRKLTIPGSCRLNLSSNDYLQLRNHPSVISSARDAMEKYGTSSSASPLLTGYLPCHEELINSLLQWKNKPAGMLFNSGFMANQAVIKNLPGRKDLILVDRLIHNSINQALLQSKAKFKRYRHLDINDLEKLLKKNHSKYETVFVITESVFSMDGDYPDLFNIASLKSSYPFIFILDEAHGTGVYGESGGGLAEEMNVLNHVDILVGTLGKALASTGAYVLTHNKSIIDYLINYSDEFIYSTFLSPAQAGSATAAISLVKSMNEPREKLKSNAVWFRQELKERGWGGDDFDSPIMPLIVGSPENGKDLIKKFLRKGMLIPFIRPPTVPANSSRFRFSLHSGITREDLLEVLEIIGPCKNIPA